MDEVALNGTRRTYTDENHHLAKVMVAGSNPGFRSIGAGQMQFFNPAFGFGSDCEHCDFGVIGTEIEYGCPNSR